MNKLFFFLTSFFTFTLSIFAQQPPCGDNPPAGNTCATATPLCSLDGVCGNTSLAEYTADYWGEPGFIFTPGTGLIGGMCGLAPTIENNSFMKFVAGSSTVNLGIWVGNCTTGEGLQFIVFKPLEGCGQGEVETFLCINGQSNTNGILENQITGLTPGEIYYIMVDGYNGDECDYAFTAEGDINLTPPIFAFAEDETVCTGGTTTLHASGGFGDYAWVDSPYLSSTTDSVVTVTLPSTPGIYEFIVGAGGSTYCEFDEEIGDTLYITVTDCENPLETSNDGPICVGETFNLIATSNAGTPTEIAWTGPNGFTSNQQNPSDVIAPSTSGSYDYILTATVDGQIYTSTTSVTVEDCECDLEVGNTGTICVGETFGLTATTAGNITSMNWTGPNGYTSSEQNPSNIIAPNTPGDYEYTFTATIDGLECSEITTLTVDDCDCNLTVGNSGPVCPGENFNLTALTEGTIASPSWTSTDGFSSTEQNPTQILAPAFPGNYNYHFSATIDGQQCSKSTVLVVNGVPEVSAGDDVNLCEGESYTIVAQNPGGATISWDNGISDGDVFIPEIVGQTYSFTVTADNGTCIMTDEINIILHDNPVVDFSGMNLFGCAPHTVDFINQSLGDNIHCFWNFGDGNSLDNCNTNISHTYQTPGNYSVNLTVTNQYGCSNSYAEMNMVQISQGAIADFNANPMTGTISNSEIDFINSSTNANSYIWIFGDNSALSYEENPSHTFPNNEEGSYIVTLIASNGNELCNDTISMAIEIEGDIIFYVPNSFTPDLDSHNEIFKPIFTSGYDPQTYTLWIYNRWGELIFESHNTEMGWNGTYGAGNGFIVKEGAYIWKIRFKEKGKDKYHEYIGHINLIK